MADNTANLGPRSPIDRDFFLATSRRLGEQDLKHAVIGGITVVGQGFFCPEDQLDLHQQCTELNRQAIMPAPETLAGRSFRDIADECLSGRSYPRQRKETND